MERIIDKGLLLTACLALATFAGDVGAPQALALTAGVSLAALTELLGGAREPLGRHLAAAGCLAAALVPGAWPTMPLLAYDALGGLSRPGREARGEGDRRDTLPAVAALAALALALVAQAPTPGLRFLLALLVATAGVLGARTRRAHALARELHTARDDLADRLLELGAKNAELQDARESEVRAAALRERTRIAREVHDSVGHLLTRLVLQTEALKLVHAREPQVVADLGELSEGLNEALTTLRRSVHAWEETGLDLRLELDRLAAGSGIRDVRVSVCVEGAMPVVVKRCLAGVACEALTNAARHAHAARAEVRVREYPGFWQLRVRNDGDVPAPDDASFSRLERNGMGLRGMRERMEELGGVLDVRVGSAALGPGAAPVEGSPVPARSQATGAGSVPARGQVPARYFEVFASVPRPDGASRQREQGRGRRA
ncbi:hypothetical protein I3I95_06855 [bacterium]|nr:hypothetical protein [bacterium]